MKLRLSMLVAMMFSSFLSYSHAQVRNAPVSIVVGTTPGGSADVSVRIVAAQLPGIISTSVVVENRPGAEWMISAQYVSKRPPNGNTILYLPSGPSALSPITHPNALIDVTKDLTPISMMGVVPMVLLVSHATPVKSLKEFVEYVRSKPMEWNYASAAATHRIATEMLMLETSTKMTLVRYTGAPRTISALKANEIQVAMLDLGSALPALRSNDARPLVIASAERSPYLPDVPSAVESGYPGFQMETWGAFYGPPGMSDTLVREWNAAFKKALESDELKRRFAELAYVSTPSSPEQLVSRILKDREKFRSVLTHANVQFD